MTDRQPGGDSLNRLDGSVTGNVTQARYIGQINTYLGAAPPTPAVPRQLPKTPEPFVDRADVHAELTRLVHEGATQIYVWGAGGVGTTGTIAAWFTENRDRFPDGGIYLRLTDPALGPLSDGEAVLRTLAALGVPPSEIPSLYAQRIALLSTILGDRALLVVLDDMTSAAQVEPFLIEARRMVVVAIGKSRNWPLLSRGFRPVHIAVLADDDSADLVGRITRLTGIVLDPDVVDGVVRTCGGTPLLLRLAAASLAIWDRAEAHHHARRFLDLGVDALATDQRDEMIRPLTLAYQMLDDDVAAAYRLLTAHPRAEFGPQAATVVLDLPADTARGRLRRLVDAALLSEDGADRYHFPDLVWQHARRVAADAAEPLLPARLRVAAWYLALATACERRLSERPRLDPRFGEQPAGGVSVAHRDAALAVLETELPNLVATVAMLERLATDPAVDEPALDEQICAFPDALWGICHLHGHHDAAITVNEIALRAARRAGLRRSEMRFTSHLGSTLLALGRRAEARRRFVESLLTARAIGDGLGAQSATEWLGKIHAAERRFPAALRMFRVSWWITETRVEAGARDRAFALLRLQTARVLNDAGRYERAAAEAEAAVRYFDARFEQAGVERDNQAKTRVAWARALAGLGRTAEARTVLHQARGLFEADNSRLRTAEVDDLLAEL